MAGARLAFETLPPDGSLPGAREGSLAAAVLSGEISPGGFTLARKAADIAPPAGDSERFEPAERVALAARLERCLATQRPHVNVLDAIRALREPGTCVVVTGQQPGLFAAPLLSLYKALHALRVAAALRETWGRPVVALFWNHADDHDIAEVHHAHFLNENVDLQRVGLAGMSSGRQPIGRLALDEQRQNLPALRAILEQSLVQRGANADERERSQRAVELFLPRHGETLAQAFTRAMTGLLGHLGLIVLEPEWIREEMSRALAQIVDHEPAAHLAENADALRAGGHEPAIDPATAALLYRLDEGGRLALRSGGEGFRFDDEQGSRTATELAAEIVQDLAAWSPGALLRPIVQDLCLPVAAYVGGLGELEYHAQLDGLRRACDAPATPFVARRSCTLVDPETAAALTRLDIDVGTVLAGELKGTLDEGASPPPAVLEQLRRAGERAAEALLAPRGELARFDRALEKNLARTAGQVRSMVEKLVSKGMRVHQNSTGKGRRHVRRVENVLRPKGRLQERVLGPLPYVARFGAEWIDALYGELDPFDPRHLVLRFAAAESDRGAEPETEERE